MPISKAYRPVFICVVLCCVIASAILAQENPFSLENTITFDTIRPHGIKLADVNNDGNKDVLYVARPWSNHGFGEDENTFGVFLGDGNGEFPVHFSYPSGAKIARSPSVGDFNNDGALDAVISHAEGKVSVFLGNGDGTFTFHQLIQAGSNNGNGDVEVGDFNSDGYDDFVLTTWIHHRVDLYRWSISSNSFVSATSINIGDACQSVAVADFDGDSNLDFAIIRHFLNTSTIYFGDGQFGFPDSSTYTIGQRSSFIIANDFNNDLTPDLALTNREDDNVSVLLSNSDRTFNEVFPRLSVWFNPIDLAFGDFDGDGISDLAVTHAWEGDVIILKKGQGDGTFVDMYEIWENVEAGRIESGDLNNDGHDDLVVNFFWDPTIKVYLTDVPCVDNEIIAKDPFGSEIYPASIQEAVDLVDSPGWEITVGSGTYDEYILVQQKTDLTIKTSCNAVVKGFRLQKSSDITIEGFIINAEGTRSHGISLMGGNNQNSDVTVSNCEIFGADLNYSGIRVARGNANTTINNCHIHNNGRNGIVFIDASGGPHFLSDNLIEANGWNGVKVARQHIITLNGNSIINNGTKSGSTGGRYGVLREAVSGSGGRPEEITLLNNVITGNNGTIREGKSSMDLGNYHQMLDATDSGNITTSGDEGPGVS